MTNFSLLAQQAAQRTWGYWLLSRLFLEVPSVPMLTDIQKSLGDEQKETLSPEVLALLDAIRGALLSPNEAAIAFTRHLCLGDKKSQEPLPYESHVREGQLPGVYTGQVEAMMQAMGYAEVASEAPSPDHLGSELRFMSLLCHEEHEAWLGSDSLSAGKSLSNQSLFLTEHLSMWAPDYCGELASRSTDNYLIGISRLARHVILEDISALEEICQWLLPEGQVADVTKVDVIH
ncbi:MAG: molecular chaperone TorD family protein [Betaproteobacteria bacterium]